MEISRLYWVLVVVGVAVVAYLARNRKRKTPDDLEQERRVFLDRVGRITDGTERVRGDSGPKSSSDSPGIPRGTRLDALGCVRVPDPLLDYP